ncbi:cell division protein FtsA [Alkaliphilus metalliredigens]|nr:pilus assembly protein PilM [Alkaliphilus metalliredigens]
MVNDKLERGSLVFALDIGTRSIIGVLGQMKDERLVIKHTAMTFHKKRAMMDGQIHDIEAVAQGVQQVKQELEEKAQVSLREVAIAAAGRSLKTTGIRVDLKVDPNQSIDQHMVESLEIEGLQKAQKALEAEMGMDSDYFCVGHTVMYYYLNDGMIGNLVGHRGNQIGADLIATFLPRIVVDSLYTVMTKVGLEVDYITLEPIAAIEVAVPQNARLLNIALVDIGAGTSDIAITRDGTVVAYSMTSTAGDEITEAIAKVYLLDFDEAERLKCNLCREGIQRFRDIVGMSYELKTEEILNEIKESIELVAHEISAHLLQQNSKAPSAIFLIGGGSQIPGIPQMIAKKLEMATARVVVRGIDTIQSLDWKEDFLTGPEGITPVGILAKAINNRKEDFIEIQINQQRMKLFQTKNLKISDVLVLAAFNPRDLIAKRGESIEINVEGKKQIIYGEYGESAKIFINEQSGSLDSRIKDGDQIKVISAEPGKNARCTLNDLCKEIVVDTTKNHMLVNGEKVSLSTLLKTGDEIRFKKRDTGHTQSHLEQERQQAQTSGQQQQQKQDKDQEQNKKGLTGVKVYCNEEPVILPQREKGYIFVDVFDFIDFDRTEVKGKLILKHNGMIANYMAPLQEGDQVAVYWEK